jgi:hypothetical protein
LESGVFPNLFCDSIRIESDEAINQIEIFSITGNSLFESKVNGLKSVVLPGNDLPRGILIIKVITNSGISITKVEKE